MTRSWHARIDYVLQDLHVIGIDDITTFSDNGSHFHNYLLMDYYLQCNKRGMSFRVNFFPPGEGKNDNDRLFGRMRQAISDYLIQKGDMNGTIDELLAALSSMTNVHIGNEATSRTTIEDHER